MRKHVELVLAQKRARLEVPRMDEIERTALVWQIDTLKQLLKIDGRAAKNVTGAGE